MKQGILLIVVAVVVAVLLSGAEVHVEVDGDRPDGSHFESVIDIH